MGLSLKTLHYIGYWLYFDVLSHRIPYNYFKGISILMLPIVGFLLIYTASQGTLIAGANASRWIRIPIIGLSFQTSTLASVVLMVYSSTYLSKISHKTPTLKSSLIRFWFPVFIIVSLIFPSNLSSALLLFTMVFILSFLAGYPLRYLMTVLCVGIVFILLFFFINKNFPRSFFLTVWILGLIELRILEVVKVLTETTR